MTQVGLRPLNIIRTHIAKNGREKMPEVLLITVLMPIADAPLKRQIMRGEVVVAITKGKLDLGPWEQIFYGEFDGNRRKRVLVKIIGE